MYINLPICLFSTKFQRRENIYHNDDTHLPRHILQLPHNMKLYLLKRMFEKTYFDISLSFLITSSKSLSFAPLRTGLLTIPLEGIRAGAL